MLSFNEKRALLNSYKELTEVPISYNRFNYYFEDSQQRGKVIVRELSHTGNAYICGFYLTGFDSLKDPRGWINIKDFTKAEIMEMLDWALDSFKGNKIAKLELKYQKWFKNQLIFDPKVFDNIDPIAKLHDEATDNPLSSAAACLNVLGSLQSNPHELLNYLNSFGLNITELIEFPAGVNVGECIYNDKGYVVFEWIGPKKSPINESGGGRGQRRTSVDAFVIGVIDNKITQILIEWKFTEGKSRSIALEKFSGHRGLERMRRYSPVLIHLRKKGQAPFDFKDEKGIGLHDFSADHLYQLLRFTLLAKTTTPINIGNIKIEDYRVVHLSHSKNDESDILHKKYLTHSPGLTGFAGLKLYDAWKSILSENERLKFIGAYWDNALPNLKDGPLKNYLIDRYYE